MKEEFKYFYNRCNGINIDYIEFWISKGRYYMRHGDCVNHIMYPTRRISEKEYIVLLEQYYNA